MQWQQFKLPRNGVVDEAIIVVSEIHQLRNKGNTPASGRKQTIARTSGVSRSFL